jgi:hypothetical protein
MRNPIQLIEMSKTLYYAYVLELDKVLELRIDITFGHGANDKRKCDGKHAF